MTDEYAATYYVYLSQHELGRSMRDCAETILHHLTERLTVNQALAFLDIKDEHPALPSDESQLVIAEQGRQWLQQVAPKFVTEADNHFSELMQQVRQMVAKTRRK